MKAVLRYALRRSARRRGRILLAAGGIAAASAMAGAAATVAFGLATGFDRAAARADLPDAIAQFDAQPQDAVAARAQALPNVRALGYRLEIGGAWISGRGHSTSHTRVEGVSGGPHGYAIVAGRDLSGRPGEVVVERGLARDWHLHVGDTLGVDSVAGTTSPFRIVGVAVEPDTLAYPLTAARAYLSASELRRLAGEPADAVNTVLLWVVDRHRLDVTLTQARAASFGLTALQFQTQSTFHALIGRAAGIVVALLLAFSLVAVAAAGLMLAASAGAEVQRRRRSIGVLRALGAARWEVAAAHAVEAAAVAAPAALIGVVVGWALVTAPLDRLLASLNELPPGGSLVGLLAGCAAAATVLVAAAAAWPALRVSARPPVEALRGADVIGAPRRTPLPSGPAGIGARLALATPVRAAAVASVLAASAAVVLLILAIASILQGLQYDPAALGDRYQLTADAPASAVAAISRVRGVAAAAPRYETTAADAFDLGESFDVVAYPGDHTAYEAPELAAGRRVRRDDEAEVGVGLAQALNLHPGATMALQLDAGPEVRFRVVGLVRAIPNEGRIVYVRPRRLLAADPSLPPTIAIRVRAGARDAVERALTAHGFYASEVGGVASDVRHTGFLRVLSALLRTVAALDGLVCLYAVAQMLALTAQERRRALAIVRACGADGRQMLRLFAGSALVVAALAAPVGIVLERNVLGPAVSNLAAAYAELPLAARLGSILVVVVGLAAAALAASGWTARAAAAEPVVAGLRDD